MDSPLESLNREIIACRRCPRLVAYRESVANTRRKQFEDWNYWGRPVPGFGDPFGRLLLVGLAPAAHGGNRTGRTFTGDKSGSFLMKCLHETGLANQPHSDSVNDGLILNQTYVTPILKCCPPKDKPSQEELKNCFPFYETEIDLLPNVRCIVALGKIAFDGCLKFWRTQFNLRAKDYPFGHGRHYELENGIVMAGCYHPSPRNVNTGRLTFEQMVSFFQDVKRIAGLEP